MRVCFGFRYSIDLNYIEWYNLDTGKNVYYKRLGDVLKYFKNIRSKYEINEVVSVSKWMCTGRPVYRRVVVRPRGIKVVRRGGKK